MIGEDDAVALRKSVKSADASHFTFADKHSRRYEDICQFVQNTDGKSALFNSPFDQQGVGILCIGDVETDC